MSRVLGFLMSAVVFISACAATPRPSSEIGFQEGAWPASGPAACKTDAAGRVRPALAQILSTDAQTVVFKLCAPDPAFIQKLAVGNFLINDSGWLNDAITTDALTTTMNGTGPFVLKVWEKGVQLLLERNESYWGAAAKARQLVIQWQSEATARLLQLRAGTVDGIDNLGTTEIASVESDPALTLLPRSGFNTFYLNFNNTVKPFDDARVRTAIALGIDADRIVKNFYPIGSEVATHIPPCVIEYACEGPGWHTRNVALAKNLLAEAGYPDGFTTSMSLRETPRSYLPDPIGVATDLQDQLKEIGVNVTLDLKDPGSYVDLLLTGQLGGLSFSASLPDYPEAWNAVALDFGEASGPEHGEQYPELVAAIDAAQFATSDMDSREAFLEVNRLLKELTPVTPIAHGASAVAVRSDVSGLTTSPVAMEQFSTVQAGNRDTFIWMQGAEPAGLYCIDEEDRDTVRVCAQVMEGLFTYSLGGIDPVPTLATGCQVSPDGLTYTCTLRADVRFHNGAALDASDVLDSFAAAWDCDHPLHVGRAKNFQRWGWIMGTLNASSCSVTP